MKTTCGFVSTAGSTSSLGTGTGDGAGDSGAEHEQRKTTASRRAVERMAGEDALWCCMATSRDEHEPAGRRLM